MIVLARSKERLLSKFDQGMIRNLCTRRCVGIESPLRRLYNVDTNGRSRSIEKIYQQRCLSSARPLPDDEHDDIAWSYDEDKMSRPAKRAPSSANTQKRLTHLSSSVSTLIPAAKMSNGDVTLLKQWSIEDSTKEIASNTSISRVAKVIENVTAASIVPVLKPSEADVKAVSTTFVDTAEHESPSALRYTGDAVIPITSILQIVKPQDDTPRGIWPVFRLLDENGEFRNPSCDGFVDNHCGLKYDANLDHDALSDNNDALLLLRSKLFNLFPYHTHEIKASGLLHSTEHPYIDTDTTDSLLRAHRQMVRLRTMDTILQNAQRQGRISFYMTCTGEEAIHIGAASALNKQDPIFAQYREQGLLMWRGFTLEQFTNQCFSNDRDLGKGRQMPIHYGSRALNYHTVSSPLGTQLPQAVGAAYRLKLMKKPNVAICFFGDGCASTTDFHAALNFAATLSVPVLFFCRNNGYAISTPVSDQYAGDGIVSRATGYGMAAIRVDGNDIFAVHAAVREAKAYALQHNAPVLIEGMTYRLGHHSTSDDSTRYRSDDEVVEFADKMDPLVRLNLFLQRYELITEEEIIKIKEEERLAVLDAIKLAEKRPKPNVDSMFTDVYKDVPLHLKKQLEELKNHMAKYPDKY